MFENGEMSLAKLMRRMGALWTKTQAAKKSNVPQAGGEPPAGPQQAGDEQALRNVLQSVTDDADVDAPEARLGRAWQQGRGGRGGGQGARPGRGRGAGRGRGGRVGNAPRATCQRCGGDYARSYLWYHRQRCVGNQDFAWGEGRGGAARGRGRGAAAEAGPAEVEPNDEEAEEAGPAEGEEPDNEAEAGQEEIFEDEIWEDGEEEEESDHEDVLQELDELERTVFGDDQDRRRGRGQKRTAMSVSSSDESESAPPAAQRRRTNRRRSLIGSLDLTLTPAGSYPATSQPSPPGPLHRSSFWASPPNRHENENTLVDDAGQPVDIDSLQMSFEVSVETAALAREVQQQQQARGDISSTMQHCI